MSVLKSSACQSGKSSSLHALMGEHMGQIVYTVNAKGFPKGITRVFLLDCR